jgi:hypothetical protein
MGDESSVECTHCGERFVTVEGYDRHLATHFQAQPPPEWPKVSPPARMGTALLTGAVVALPCLGGLVLLWGAEEVLGLLVGDPISTAGLPLIVLISIVAGLVVAVIGFVGADLDR